MSCSAAKVILTPATRTGIVVAGYDPQAETASEVVEDKAMAFLGAISGTECRHVHGQVVI